MSLPSTTLSMKNLRAGKPLRQTRKDQFLQESQWLDSFISESTRRDFNSFYPELTESIPNEVVYLGNNFVQSGEVVLQRKAQFLFVGSRSGYKNFENACKAFELLSEKFKDVKFIVAGPPPSKIDRKVSSGIRKIEWVTKPSDMELARLFSSSLGLLYVSRYEGFWASSIGSNELGLRSLLQGITQVSQRYLVMQESCFRMSLIPDSSVTRWRTFSPMKHLERKGLLPELNARDISIGR